MDAFKLARKDLGPCSEYNWRGNKYSACKYGETIESVALKVEANSTNRNTEKRKGEPEQIIANK